MIHLRLRSEYNLKRAYGDIEKLVQTCIGKPAMGLADVGTWGHVNFQKYCKKYNIKPIFGAEIAVVADAANRIKQTPNYMAFLARNNAGLREIYELVTLSTEQFFYFPRIDYGLLPSVSENVIILSGTTPNLELLQYQKNMFIEASFLTPETTLQWANNHNFKCVATIDNYYPTAEDKLPYEILMGKDRDNRMYPQFVCGQELLKYHKPNFSLDFYQMTYDLADECNVELPKAQNVKFKSEKTLEQLCREAAPKRGINLENDVYEQRLMRELNMIAEKEFEDYFYVLWDLIAFAKTKMLVGPARGSSCGSLVCYLLGITEIDPIPYDLLFERFIDVTRKDLPDVDVDFADDRRDLVFDYLKEKYGNDCVARLGTILRFKAKSAIGTVAKETMVPEWEISELKDSIIERSGGDSRAKFCIMDTFEQLEIGKAAIAKYPELRYAQDLEQHAHHSGQHAAGIVVTNDPVSNYCSLDKKNGALQVDKYDAETLNLLKIDALGLRTLSILQDTIDQVGMSREELYGVPLNDKKAFDVLNNNKYAGIFQFEGFALQSLTKQMKIQEFEDIVAITALARPGPLNSGSATDFVQRRIGAQEVAYLHPLCEPMTKVTYGTVIYQEQVMSIGREIGKLSWEDVSSLRKAMSKSLGQEFFDRYWVKFRQGALENGLKEDQARHIWDHINTMGSWSFNRSHAVAYGLVSYWCCYLKAHFPLQFAAANLRNSKNNDQVIRLLRELHKEGISYIAFDKTLSEVNWSIKGGKLIGGFMGLHGCGAKTAQEIVRRREKAEALTPGQLKLVSNATTPYDDIFECQTKFGHIKAEPEKYNIITPITNIEDIRIDEDNEVLIFGKIKEKNMRDMNEEVNLAKRGGKRVDKNQYWLNFTVEDDTTSIICTIGRFDFERLGRPIIESMVEGKDWLLIRGQVKKGFRKIYVKRYRHLTPREN